MSGFFKNLCDESTANQDCQVMEQLGASLYKTISIHNVNEPRDKFIVVKRDYKRNSFSPDKHCPKESMAGHRPDEVHGFPVSENIMMMILEV